MKTQNSTIILEEPASIGIANPEFVCYTDITGINILIPMKVLVHLYECSKFSLERNGIKWDEYVSTLGRKNEKT